MSYTFRGLKLKIRNELKKQGYENKYIDYEEFLELYEPYKTEISERNFADILGISYANWQAIKHKKGRTKILKKEYKKISDERKEEILEDIKHKGYVNKLIYYTEFLELYETYKSEISEIEFAEILGISTANFSNLKNNRTRAKICKTQQYKEIEQRKNEIQKELLNKGYNLKPTNYEEFLQLYDKYKEEFDEETFVYMLKIRYSDWEYMKKDRDEAKKLNISLKEFIQNRRRKIEEDIKNQGYVNELINYEEFMKLYANYKEEISEIEFANILGINEDNLRIIKHSNNKRTTVFKVEYTEATEERKNQIRKNILNLGFENTYITYEEFLKLYEPYKNEITEKEFANILGLRANNWQSMRHLGVRTRILKNNYKEISKDKKEEIKQKIRSMGYANKLIKYEDFLKLYEPYKNEISENDFAQIIGIATVNLNSLRLGKFRARVLKSSPIELMKNCIESGMGKDETIKYCMKECGLSKEELLKEMENYQREENLKRNKSKESR